MYNPIRQVDGNTNVPCPTSYKWLLDDVSSDDAGRTEDVTMQKMRIGQVVGLELEWKHVSLADASIILAAFDPEYISVKYLDAKAGVWVESEFYVGNRSGTLFNSEMGYWEKISFKITKRKGV